jgi:hypothetical protein
MSFNNVLQKAVLMQDITDPVSLKYVPLFLCKSLSYMSNIYVIEDFGVEIYVHIVE